ncbi:MAG: TIM barrel protein [Planctomycetes bacterium]|nr:TIM barrel protein [Planctomycetota bacterium]MCH8118381.1 TIM barrel protein [Planctomycetota bacterium]
MPYNRKGFSRREFLSRGIRVTTVAVATTALASCNFLGTRDATKRDTRTRFGLTTYQWGKDWNIPTLIANCCTARAFGVELRTSQSYAHGVELELSAQQRREVRKRFEDSPITLVGIATSERYDSPEAAKLKTAIENTKAYIKLSRDIGGSGVRVFPNSFHDGVPRAKTIEQIGNSLNIVGAFAADYGQQVRLEAHGNAGELPVLRAIMDHVVQPSVRVKLNSDKRDTKGNGFEHNFNLVKGLLGDTLHLHNLKNAEFPYQLQMDLLVKMGWSGWQLLEVSDKVPDRVQALIEQRQIWDRLLSRSLIA